ncbi:hypothetical protein K458DRAFT_139754 [Lentithecium fluviatile CBS 122367]|uniref:Defect at low temperature protein 1 n=1 Tax=Lentithecium fluviatile CBS 122367 TaxID=1168545 RepID=A0A6G1IK00_9PLEO|nr:hypothetical protein K458DRAFT_139754 [Lentithecium fluviatile CBS 122367]
MRTLHPPHINFRIPTLFRIWYSTTYTILFGALLLLLAVTPADTIYQSIRSSNNRTSALQKLFVIGGVYVLTFLIVLLVYSTRLYTNRSVLQAIPKPYVPVEEGEVGRGVRRMVVKMLRRSAVVAWDSRPRDVRAEVRGTTGTGEEGQGEENLTTGEKAGGKRKGSAHAATIIPISLRALPWGHISHPGWASPASDDLPNLQYDSVVAELPNLIEAKAVSLAPPDPAVEDHAHAAAQDTPMLPDAHIVALLQRPRAMGLRDYLARLSSFGLLDRPSLGPKFLALYEYARFSTHALTESEFRALMAVFAEILNGMTTLDPGVMASARTESLTPSDRRSLAPSVSTHDSSLTGLPYTTPMVDRESEFSFANGGGSASSPQTLRTAYTLPRTPSMRSVAGSEQGSVRRRVVHGSPETILPNSSSSSLRSAGSVVRLRERAGEGALPYEFRFGDG